MGVIGPIIFFIGICIYSFLEEGDSSGVKFLGGVAAFIIIILLIGVIFFPEVYAN